MCKIDLIPFRQGGCGENYHLPQFPECPNAIIDTGNFGTLDPVGQVPVVTCGLKHVCCVTCHRTDDNHPDFVCPFGTAF